jgi:hypothetical protein
MCEENSFLNSFGGGKHENLNFKVEIRSIYYHYFIVTFPFSNLTKRTLKVSPSTGGIFLTLYKCPRCLLTSTLQINVAVLPVGAALTDRNLRGKNMCKLNLNVVTGCKVNLIF